MKVFIGIGSNLGNRLKNIQKGTEYLKDTPKIKVEKVSAIIETDPQGGPPQKKYLNGVIKLNTDLEPQELLKILQNIENKLGRKREIKNGPRTIDLDILLYDDRKINKNNLIIPHLRVFERLFTLKPLVEIEPDIIYTHPLVKKYKDKILKIIETHVYYRQH